MNLLRHALRSLRREALAGDLLTVFAALVLGVAVMTAVGTLVDRVNLALANSTAEMLGGDLGISGRAEAPAELVGEGTRRGLQSTRIAAFGSVLFHGEARQMATIKAGDAGYPLGGNSVLGLALRAPSAGVPLRRVASVCPVLDPAITMESIENGPAMYDWYFRRKWAGSLRRKRDLFPELSDWDDRVLKLDIRALTAWLVEHHTEFGTLQAYFDGYSIAGDRLAGLEVPADILMAQDDPVIPYATFNGWRLPAHARLEIAPWGGHCGFLENWRGDGFSERWVAQRLSLEALR